MKRVFIYVLISFLLTGCSTEEKKEEQQKELVQIQEKEEKEMKEYLEEALKKCEPIYGKVKKGDSDNLVLSEEIVHEMINILSKDGTAVICGNHDSDMKNFEQVEKAILQGKKGKNLETEFFEINKDGYFFFYRLFFQKKELIITSASASFNENREAEIHQIEKYSPYSWKYTEKGWLIWEKECSPNQEMDMHILYRIRPLEEKCRVAAQNYILPVSYFCNNLFLTDWNEENMDKICFLDLYDFLYEMKYKKEIDKGQYKNGVPKKEFEEVIKTFFDLSTEQIEKYARYNPVTGTYPWEPIGMWNRVQQFLPFPEVVNYIENEDGTITLLVEAVFQEEGTDCSFQHRVTIKKNGEKWYYIENKLNSDQQDKVPKYQPRSSF